MQKVFLLFPVMLALAGCDNHTTKFNGCVERGIAYFKSINRYPRLTNGSLADDAVQKHCTESVVAY